jgi:uncharacterized protein (DUF1800 family)
MALAAGSASAVDVIEYYNASLDHYFITWVPAEIANLDSGKTKGWTRTGQAFQTYTTPQSGTSPVCRYYIPPALGDSHFFGRGTTECNNTGQKNPSFVLESSDFMQVFLPVAGTCPAGTAQVYRVFSNRPDANHRYMVSKVVRDQMIAKNWLAEGDGPDLVVMCAPVSVDADVDADIVRLLEQSTMGVTEALIVEVKQKGIEAWLDEQLELYESRYTPWPEYRTSSMAERDQCIALPICRVNNIAPDPVVWEFYRQAVNGRDQVRQRFAYVLHQLFVLGQGGPAETYAIGNFQQRVRDFAFSTYEDALYQYSVSPQLGNFQGWANNRPEQNGIKPNENYAREILQLLTTGVYRVNEDGTQQKDDAGNAIPAYDQADVSTLARVFTGFVYPTAPGTISPSINNGNAYSFGPMVPLDQYHDKGAKSLFGGAVQMPAGQGADADVRAAIRALVADSNTPPFICRQLIQRLVTSAPTPAYVQRMVNVFKDNGSGVRGDLKAVLRAILLDPEARGARKTDPGYGRMREPALFFTSIMRALDVQTDGYMPLRMGGDTNMQLFSPPTIFSYFPADFTILNGTLPAAEFGIYGTSAYVVRTNIVNRFIFLHSGDEGIPQPVVPNATGTPFPTMAAFLASTADPAVYVARLNRLFFHGTMSAASRKTITNAVAAIPASDPLTRAKLGAYLALTSLDYLIQK